MDKPVKKAQAVRRGIYFSESDADLLEYIDSQEVSASKFVTQIIREKMEGRLHQPLPLSEEDLTNRQLLEEIKSLMENVKGFGHGVQSRLFNQIKSSDEIGYSGKATVYLDGMDDFS